MSSSFRLTTIALAAGLLSATASAAPPSGLGAEVTVNGRAISQNHVTLMSANFSPDKSAPSAEARAAARAELITEEVLAQQARKEGLDKNPIVADQLSFQERAILSRAYLEDYFAKNPVTDESLKKAYEWNRANNRIQEYRVRQILVTSSEQAQDLIARIAKGEDFTSLAKRYTQDPGGQANGGDLGWFRPDIFVDHNFSDAVVALKKGGTSAEPLRTRFGWHVIKVEDGPRLVEKPLAYDQLDEASKLALRQKTVQVQLESLTARLSSGAKIGGAATSASTVARNAP